ncbi:vitamin B12 transporter [Dysgonomonas sp. PH5-45]|uniref:TonB-dependent receptor plug domain-containing protein n=1 Tax=unclassified Dysgonomonas TaxID=2630389 RepID=UPI002475502A|nr:MULTISPECIES: TonB-dependent receptor plug domain-containing protein [unclassified Dysgonomonas]MDH6355570.1 vitamin B12 transporter [Dysgonomonas sp. PH5-45]MDH6388467.1 vitamin B12 transporter [Dysgonomonas sp. PH5-37]
MNLKKLLFFFVLLNMFSVAVYAQSEDSVRIKGSIDEVKIISTRNAMTGITVTSPLQLLTSKEIQATGIASLSDAVRRFSGVTVKDYGGIGGMKTVSIRGFNAQHTAVVYDGVSVSDAQTGVVDIGRFSLDNVSTITMIIGVQDDIFQSARNQASAGVLNIKTQSPVFGDRRYKGSAQVKTGSWGLFNPAVNFAYKLNSRFTLSADANWQRADGRYKYKIDNGTQSGTFKRKNSDVDILRTEVNLYGRLGDNQSLNIKLYYFDSERGLPGHITLYNDYSTERLWNENFFTQVQYKNFFSDKFSYQANAKYDYNKARYEYTHTQLGRTDKYIQNEYYLSNTLMYRPNGAFSFSLGEDLVYNKLKNDNVLNDNLRNPSRQTSITALSGKYQANRLTVITTLLGSYAKDDIKVTGNQYEYKRIVPSFGVTYSLLDANRLNFRLAYKDIFRIPTITEVYYKRSGVILKPEKARQLNMGLVWADRLSDVMQSVNISVDAYYAHMKDKISIIPTTSFIRTDNIGKVRMTGIDAVLKTNLFLTEYLSLLVSGAYSYLKAVDITSKTDSWYKNQIPYTPKHSGSVSFGLENPWVNVTYTGLFSGRRYYSPENIASKKVAGYADHTIALNKQLNIKWVEYTFQLAFTNILNKQYQIINYYPMPGRAVNVSVGCKF